MAERHETQEQSIKARKSELYDAEAKPSGPRAYRKPFAVLRRETPPTPLSLGVKAILWGVGLVVVGLLVLTFLTAGKAKPAPKPKAKAAAPVKAVARLVVPGFLVVLTSPDTDFRPCSWPL